ncbi:methyltransferase domain-containing protein [Methylobacterium sp. P5_C11]
MYDFSWHQRHSEKTRISAEVTLSILLDIFHPESMLDVGCGDGIWLQKAGDLGFAEFNGVDGPWTDMDKLLISEQNITILDLEQSFNLDRRFDVAISLEVAEHISSESSEKMVENLVRHSDVVLFGAAIPYQGGFRHINEMWQSWWASKFAERGYQCFDVIRPQIWNRNDVHYWYKQNALVYVNVERKDYSESFERYATDKSLIGWPLDIVHPEKYESIASYKQIAFKPLLRELPNGVAEKLKGMLLRNN